MSQRVSSAGLTLLYCVETTAGTRPTSGYTEVPEVKSVPSFNTPPEQIESTTLKETVYRTYVPGLRDLSSALEFGANMTDDLDTAWTALITATATAAESNKATWFCVAHPKLTKATYFTGEPAHIGLNEAGVNAMYETTLYITPTSAPERQAKPTGWPTVNGD